MISTLIIIATAFRHFLYNKINNNCHRANVYFLQAYENMMLSKFISTAGLLDWVIFENSTLLCSELPPFLLVAVIIIKVKVTPKLLSSETQKVAQFGNSDLSLIDSYK